MNRVLIIGLATCLIAGCADKGSSQEPITFTAWNENWSTQTTYQLSPEGEKIWASLLASSPDTDDAAAIGLDPSGMLILKGKHYAVEPDMIVYMGKNRTRIWRRQGIRARLIQNAEALKEPPNNNQ